MKTKGKHRRKKMYSKRKKKYGRGKPISDKEWKKLMNSIKRIRSKGNKMSGKWANTKKHRYNNINTTFLTRHRLHRAFSNPTIYSKYN